MSDLRIVFQPNYYFRRPLQGDAGMGEWIRERTFAVKRGDIWIASNCPTYDDAQHVVFRYLEDMKEVIEQHPDVAME